jgi:tetratricopeptide (TPR) repeat protein
MMAMRLGVRHDRRDAWTRQDIQMVRSLGPKVVEENEDTVIFQEAALYENEGNLIDAIRVLDQFLQKKPDFPNLRNALESLLYRGNQALLSALTSESSPRETAALFETLMEMGELDFMAMVLMVDMYAKSGALDKSEALRKKILAVAPHHPALQMEGGN